MKKDLILKKNYHFDEIIRNGDKISNNYFVIFFLDDKKTDKFKIGISVGKKIGNAPCRNLEKRRIRHILRENIKHIPTNKKYVIILKKQTSDFKKETQKILSLFERIEIEK